MQHKAFISDGDGQAAFTQSLLKICLFYNCSYSFRLCFYEPVIPFISALTLTYNKMYYLG